MSDLKTQQDRYERFVERIEIPMLVLSLLLIPVVLMPFVEELSKSATRALWWLSILIWIGFALEYVLLVYLATDRRQTVATHKLDLLLVLLPMLRPLRLVRIIRLAKDGTAFGRIVVAFRRLVGRPGFGSALATVTGFILGGGALVTIAEHEQPQSTISNLADGIWWAFVTCTTVGYGDEFPITSTGRVVAVFLMLAGISGLSVITANIAAYFVSTDAEDEAEDLSEQLARIELQLKRLTAQLDPAE